MLSVARYGTNNFDKAVAFYDEITALLGASRVIDRDEVKAYKGPEGGMFLIGKPLVGDATVGNGTQVGFRATSRAMIDTVHAKALELGGSCEGPPGVRGPEGVNAFYAAYFRDLDGNKVMVSYIGE